MGEMLPRKGRSLAQRQPVRVSRLEFPLGYADAMLKAWPLGRVMIEILLMLGLFAVVALAVAGIVRR